MSDGSKTMNRLWWDRKFRITVREGIRRLAPWYQSIYLGAGIWTCPRNLTTLRQWCNSERGKGKWTGFILPLIGPHLKDATVIELGTNAGHNLVLALRFGARRAVGVEPDARYFEQAMLVRECLGLEGRISLARNLADAKILVFWEGLQWEEGPKTKRLGLLCAVLRHVPANERVRTLERMAELCERVLINGNGLADAPEGDNAESIFAYLRQAGLRVEQMRCFPHCRGLTILARAP